MRNLNGPVIILTCVTGILFSCAEDTVIDYDNIKPKLVIQSRLVPDSVISLNITSSLISTDPSTYSVPDPDNISVSMINTTNETGSVINFRFKDGNFVSQTYPKIGESFALIVDAPGFKQVESETSIPEIVDLDSYRVLRLKQTESTTTPDKINVSYDLLLNFKPHNHQYFHFIFIQRTSINVGSPSNPNIEERAYYINPESAAEDGFYPLVHENTDGLSNTSDDYIDAGVLIDAYRTGTSQSLSFSFKDYTLSGLEELGALLIEVRAVTPEYYYYNSSLSRQLFSRDDPFAEPVPVYNNIQGGYGNFSGYSSKYFQLQIIP